MTRTLSAYVFLAILAATGAYEIVRWVLGKLTGGSGFEPDRDNPFLTSFLH